MTFKHISHLSPPCWQIISRHALKIIQLPASPSINKLNIFQAAIEGFLLPLPVSRDLPWFKPHFRKVDDLPVACCWIPISSASPCCPLSSSLGDLTSVSPCHCCSFSFKVSPWVNWSTRSIRWFKRHPTINHAPHYKSGSSINTCFPTHPPPIYLCFGPNLL